jgi:hypothetical protein
MELDLRRLRRGEQLAGVGAILLFVVFFFFKWYGVGGDLGRFAKAAGVDVSSNGWQGHSVLRWLVVLTILAALALVFLQATRRTVALPVTLAVITTALAGLTTVLLAYRVVIDEPGPNAYVDVKLGAWLGLLSAALIFYAGYLSMRDEGTSFDDARAQARAAGAQARAAFERPAAPPHEATAEPPARETPPAPTAPTAGDEGRGSGGAPPPAAP